MTDGLKIFHCELFFLASDVWKDSSAEEAAAASERSASGRGVQGSLALRPARGHKKIWQVFCHRRVAICQPGL